MTTAHTATPRVKRWTDEKLEKELCFAYPHDESPEAKEWYATLNTEHARRAALAKAGV